MKLFNTPVRKIMLQRMDAMQKNLARWLQRQSCRMPVKVQQVLLLIVCILVTVYCVLLILQPLIH